MTNTAYRAYKPTDLCKHAPPVLMEIEDSKDFPKGLVVRLWEIKAKCALLWAKRSRHASANP